VHMSCARSGGSSGGGGQGVLQRRAALSLGGAGAPGALSSLAGHTLGRALKRPPSPPTPPQSPQSPPTCGARGGHDPAEQPVPGVHGRAHQQQAQARELECPAAVHAGVLLHEDLGHEVAQRVEQRGGDGLDRDLAGEGGREGGEGEGLSWRSLSACISAQQRPLLLLLGLGSVWGGEGLGAVGG
jgi:hypothetical protein